jgi:hypothetical protein
VLARQARYLIALSCDTRAGVVKLSAGLWSRYGLVQRPGLATLTGILWSRSASGPDLPGDGDRNENDVERRHKLTTPALDALPRRERRTGARAEER